MPLIVYIVGCVLVGIGIWGTALAAFGSWYYLDILFKARYKRGGGATARLHMKYDACLLLWLTFFVGMLTAGLLWLMVVQTWALVLTVIAALGWVVTGLMLQDYYRALRKLPKPAPAQTDN